MTVIQILKKYWNSADNYVGTISIQEEKQIGKTIFYIVETEGNTFEVVRTIDSNIVFLHCALEIGNWIATDGVDKTKYVIEIKGIPYLAPQPRIDMEENSFIFENTDLSVNELANLSGKSTTAVYNLAAKLGRLPTFKELINVKMGRPKKY